MVEGQAKLRSRFNSDALQDEVVAALPQMYSTLRSDRSDAGTMLGWSAEDVRDLKGSLWDATSLNQPLGSDPDASEVGEFIEDERASEVAGAVIGEMEMEWLAGAVEGLPERHRYVLIRRYGLGGEATGLPLPSSARS